MPHSIGLPEGAVISHTTGCVRIRLACVRPGQSYRVSTCLGSTGAEIPELTASFPTEVEARRVARAVCVAFRDGRPVREVLDGLALVLSEALAAAMGGGGADQGRRSARVVSLSRALEVLKTPEQRAADDDLAARIAATMSDCAAREGLPVGPARSFREIRDRHQAAMQRDRLSAA